MFATEHSSLPGRRVDSAAWRLVIGDSGPEGLGPPAGKKKKRLSAAPFAELLGSSFFARSAGGGASVAKRLSRALPCPDGRDRWWPNH